MFVLISIYYKKILSLIFVFISINVSQETKDSPSQTKESDIYKELNDKMEELTKQIDALTKENNRLTQEVSEKEALNKEIKQAQNQAVAVSSIFFTVSK